MGITAWNSLSLAVLRFPEAESSYSSISTGPDYFFTPTCQVIIVFSISNYVSIVILLPDKRDSRYSLFNIFISFSCNCIALSFPSYLKESPMKLHDFVQIRILNLATRLPSPKHILTYTCNGQASSLAALRRPR